MRHTDWDDLDVAVRRAIEDRTGPVSAARTARAGLNSQIAAILETAAGTVFVKGLPADHPGAVRQAREALINPYVRRLSPALLWQAEVAGWSLLAFDYVCGARHADYRPGSPDLPRVISLMDELAGIGCPDLPALTRARQRWAAFVADHGDLGLLDGDTLLHTDLSPLNILLTADRTWLIDWAWPTRGAAFIDPACLVIRAMSLGHTAAGGEALARQCSGWRQAVPRAIDVFAVAAARLYGEIAREDPQPFKVRLAGAARDWARHRLKTSQRR